MGRLMRLSYASSLSEFVENNSSFDSGVLRVAYTDANRNGSFISKETYEKCINTIYNCPIVCNYNREDDSIGSHDIDIVRDDDGTIRIVNVTTPVGVVPESAKYSWETITEDDGSTHEYLCVDVLLWKRQEAYKKIRDDGIVSESMEIQVNDGFVDENTGLYVINDFEFNAFCLLGEGVEPCFESASLEVFSCADFKKQLEQMMADLKTSFNLVTTSEEVDDIHPQNYSMEGGEVLDEKLALIAEYGLNVDELEFAINDFSLEELKVKLDEIKASNDNVVEEFSEEPAVKPIEEPAAEPVEEPAEFALNSELRDEMRRAIAAETIARPWGEDQKYWMVDFDEASQMVYFEDTEDWKLYGCPYSMNGDNIVIDFECRKRKKYAIVDFDEGEQVMPLADMFAHIEQRYQTASDTISSMTAELEELRQFQNDTKEAAAQAEREEVFEKFNELDGIEAFELLKENCKDMSADEVEEKCFAIRGRIGYTAKFSMEPKAPKIKVTKEPAEERPYGGIVEKYLGEQI